MGVMGVYRCIWVLWVYMGVMDVYNREYRCIWVYMRVMGKNGCLLLINVINIAFEVFTNYSEVKEIFSSAIK